MRPHFDLDYFGAAGLKVTPEVCGKNGKVETANTKVVLDVADIHL